MRSVYPTAFRKVHIEAWSWSSRSLQGKGLYRRCRPRDGMACPLGTQERVRERRCHMRRRGRRHGHRAPREEQMLSWEWSSRCHTAKEVLLAVSDLIYWANIPGIHLIPASALKGTQISQLSNSVKCGREQGANLLEQGVEWVVFVGSLWGHISRQQTQFLTAEHTPISHTLSLGL